MRGNITLIILFACGVGLLATALFTPVSREVMYGYLVGGICATLLSLYYLKKPNLVAAAIVIAALILGGLYLALSGLNFLENKSDWETYRNSDYGFQFSYPKDVRISTPESFDPARILSLEFSGPNNVMTGLLIIGVTKNSSCPDVSKDGDARNIFRTKINGVDFVSYIKTEYAAGLVDVVAQMQTDKNNTCFNIAMVLEGENPNRLNKEKMALQSADNKVITAKLDSIISTFKFFPPDK